MTRTHGPHPLLAQLEAVLDTHGARPAGWPGALRAKLLALIETDADAARLFAEAQALDALLAKAAIMPPDGLEARIMAASATLPRTPSHVETPPFRPVVTPMGNALVARASVRPANRRMWPELTLLAASLFLGLLIGLSGQALPALQDVSVLAGDDDAWGGIAGLLFDGGSDKEVL